MKIPSLCLCVLIYFSSISPLFASFDDATKAYIFADYETARYHALIAAQDGMPEAQMLMGQLYLRGEGVEKDEAVAAYWYGKAAEQGFQEAQYLLGKFYYHGQGVKKDYTQAKKWLSKAVKDDHKEATDLLNNLYETDTGAVVNLEESRDVLVKAANEGVLHAQYLLGLQYIKNESNEEQVKQAVDWIRRSAMQGYILSQKYLGELYAKGLGVKEDVIEAYAWSMAYAGERRPKFIYREGRSVAARVLRKEPTSIVLAAYSKSKEYHEKYVKPFHPNARAVGPDSYRVVVPNSPSAIEAKRKREERKKQAELAKQSTPLKTTAESPQQANTDIKRSAPDTVTTDNQISDSVSVDASKSVIPQQNPVTPENPSVLKDAMNEVSEPSRDAVDIPPVVKDDTIKRSSASITLVIDESRSLIDAAYQRALKIEPNLEGAMELEITIEPSGKVSKVETVSTELELQSFEDEIHAIIKKLTFKAGKFATAIVRHPLTFIRP